MNPLSKNKGSHLFSLKVEVYIAFLSIVAIITNLFFHFILSLPNNICNIPLIILLVLGGIPIIVDLGKKLTAGDFGSDLLAGVSILAALFLQEYLVASIIVLMLSGGKALETFAARRASRVLEALAKRLPQIAHRKNQNEIVDIDIDEILVGDSIVIYPHEIVPADGIVIEGFGLMDESFLTGEPYDMSKAPGSDVISGAINQESAITIKVTREAKDSRYAKIMQVMQDSSQRKPQIRRLGDRLGALYTPIALLIAIAAWLITKDPHRFLSIVVVATPCPLLIAIPVAIIGAISVSARRGIIIKNPAILEEISRCSTLIFDKTGTLTYGKPSLTDIVTAPTFNKSLLLALVASLEKYSKHPLSAAIINQAHRLNLPQLNVESLSERPGRGLTGVVQGRKITITGRGSLLKENSPLLSKLPAMTSGLECVAIVDNEFAALLRFHDAPRVESRLFIDHLIPKHNIKKVMLISGDRESEVQYLAKSVGISEIFANQSPENKVAIVKKETQKSTTLFVGDGINDAPAMMAATVGVAFGQSNEITMEAADAVLLEPNLGKVDELIHIGRRMRNIALESAIGGMALSIIGMGLAAFGLLPPIAGAITQEIIDLLAVLNAVRVAIPVRNLTDF